MKNILLYILFAGALFSACKKDDSHLFDKSPDQRLNEAMAAYQTQLQGATNGWKALIYPKSGGIYTFYFKFNNANRVQMLSSFDSVSAVTLKESSYRLKALQQPSLVFDTYSYLHVLSDPSPGVNGGPAGAGLQSDFEFYFDSTTADTVKLVGRQNGTKAVLVRATQPEATAFNAGQLANGLLVNKIQTYYKRITVGSVSLDFNFDLATRSVKLTDNSGNLLDSSRILSYYLTLNGIAFARPIVVGSLSIAAIDNLNYNATTQTMTCSINTQPATITQVVTPIKVDANAPSRWWNYAVSRQSFYASFNGFHVNGVEDAYKLHSIPGYSFLYYEPKAVPNGNIVLDFLGPVVNDSLNYGAALRPPFFTGNVVVFQYLGDFGNVPASHLPMYISTVSKMIDGSGYYLIQTSASTYDMVGARDGKTWIQWISSQ